MWVELALQRDQDGTTYGTLIPRDERPVSTYRVKRGAPILEFDRYDWHGKMEDGKRVYERFVPTCYIEAWLEDDEGNRIG
jgi:hypothetical protein